MAPGRPPLQGKRQDIRPRDLEKPWKPQAIRGHQAPPHITSFQGGATKNPHARESREILEDFGIDIDSAENGVFLPANKRSPNPNGSSVHSRIHGNQYYLDLVTSLRQASNRAEAVDVLQSFRSALLSGDYPK